MQKTTLRRSWLLILCIGLLLAPTGCKSFKQAMENMNKLNKKIKKRFPTLKHVNFGVRVTMSRGMVLQMNLRESEIPGKIDQTLRTKAEQIAAFAYQNYPGKRKPNVVSISILQGKVPKKGKRSRSTMRRFVRHMYWGKKLAKVKIAPAPQTAKSKAPTKDTNKPDARKADTKSAKKPAKDAKKPEARKPATKKDEKKPAEDTKKPEARKPTKADVKKK